MRQQLGITEETPKIPDYEILRCIGVGGYGKVYLARDSLGGYCAIKLVRHAASVQDKAYERELHGLQLYSSISRLHEGFVDVLHIGRNDGYGYFYYVMELGDPVTETATFTPESYTPKTLQSQLEASGALSPPECIRLGVSLSSAISFLHHRGLVHRDIKPANIIFVHGIPRLADPGLVSQVASQMSAVGTLGFMDPATHGQKLGDIYSLGRVLYVAATGLPVSQYPSLPTIAADRRREFLELNEVFLRAGASDPASRYQTVEELLAHLAILQAGDSIRTAMLLTRWWRGLRRYAVWLLILLCLGVFSGWQGFQTVRQASELRQRQVGSYLAYGSAAVDKQNNFEALPWYAAALELEQNNPDRARNHRLRIGSTLAASPRLIRVWAGVPKTAQFSADGNHVLFVDTNGAVVTMDVESGDCMSRVPIKIDTSDLTLLSPNGRFVFASDSKNNGLIWNATNGELILSFPVPGHFPYLRAAFAPNDKSLAIVNFAGGLAQVVDCTSGKTLKQYSLPGGGIQDLVWNNSGQLLAVSSRSNGVTILDANSGRTISTFTNHSKWVYAAVFSPREPVVISAGSDRFARLWSLETGIESLRLLHGGMVSSVSFSADGNRCATAAFDNLARIFDAHSGNLIYSPLPHENPVVRAVISPPGNRLLTSSLDGTLRVWDLNSANWLWSAPALTASGTGEHLAWRESSNVITIQTLGQPVKRFTVSESPVQSLVLDAHGHYLMAFSAGPAHSGAKVHPTTLRASLWDTTTGQSAGQPFEIQSFDSQKAFRPNGLGLAIIDGSTLRVWNTQTGALLATVSLQTSNCSALVWHPSLNRIALALGPQAMIYDVGLGRMLWAHSVQHSNSMPIASICFSPDQQTVATTCADNFLKPGEARLWNAETGEARGGEFWHKDGVRDVAFSPDGRWLATASEDFTALVWEVATGRIVGRALRQPDEIHAVCFASSRRWLATACRNGDARIWDLETSEPLTPPLHHDSRLIHVRFVENDNALLTETADGHSWLWRFSFDERPVEQIQLWARILSADRSGPPLKNSTLSRTEAFKKLNSAPVQTKASTTAEASAN
jgi:WD40 repeat protein